MLNKSVKGFFGCSCEQTYFTLILALYAAKKARGGDNSFRRDVARSCSASLLVFFLLVV